MPLRRVCFSTGWDYVWLRSTVVDPRSSAFSVCVQVQRVQCRHERTLSCPRVSRGNNCSASSCAHAKLQLQTVGWSTDLAFGIRARIRQGVRLEQGRLALSRKLRQRAVARWPLSVCPSVHPFVYLSVCPLKQFSQVRVSVRRRSVNRRHQLVFVRVRACARAAVRGCCMPNWPHVSTRMCRSLCVLQHLSRMYFASVFVHSTSAKFWKIWSNCEDCRVLKSTLVLWYGLHRVLR